MLPVMVHGNGDDGKEAITRLLARLREGHKEAAEALLKAVYQDLKRRAASFLRKERPDHTLQPTALVHEAYLQLMGQEGGDWRDRAHFFAAATTAMRHILVDHARKRRAAKRRGDLPKMELNDLNAITENRLDEVVAVDEALTNLAAVYPRQSRVVEMRYFAGLTEDEIAAILEVAPRTVKRDWKFARAWLRGELSSAQRA